MKFEVKQLKAESHSRGYIAQEYVNNPLGVSLAVGTALQLLPGVNISDEGEFIPAPGFQDRTHAESTKTEDLRCVISDICVQVRERDAKLARIASYVDNVLSAIETPHGSQYTASKMLEILRGEA